MTLATDHDDERPRLLLAEDDDELRTLLELALSDDFHVVSMEDRLELLDYLELSKAQPPRAKAPDAILSDLCMPGGAGLDLLDQIRGLGFRGPLGLMSAFADPEMARCALTKGANFFVYKPLDIEELIVRLKGLLNEEHARSHGRDGAEAQH
jgi:DNA-binding response OmpR family regulator